jgi:hypothetical protein
LKKGKKGKREITPSNTDLQGISFYLTPPSLSDKRYEGVHYPSRKLKTNGFF